MPRFLPLAPLKAVTIARFKRHRCNFSQPAHFEYGKSFKMKRCFSLKRNKEFRHVYRRGKSKAAKNMVLIYAKQNHQSVRIGLSVSKKIGNSVVRNKVKRRLRAALACVFNYIEHGYSLIIIAREPITSADFSTLQTELSDLIRRADLYTRTKKL